MICYQASPLLRMLCESKQPAGDRVSRGFVTTDKHEYEIRIEIAERNLGTIPALTG